MKSGGKLGRTKELVMSNFIKTLIFKKIMQRKEAETGYYIQRSVILMLTFPTIIPASKHNINALGVNLKNT